MNDLAESGLEHPPSESSVSWMLTVQVASQAMSNSESVHPRVSIIIPTHNSRRWLGQAVDSALAQTYPHCEIIVIDDGSTDGTGEWVQRQYGDQIRYVWHEHRGRGAARNRGIEIGRGEYVQFLDADDILAPRKVATHVKFLDAHPGVGAVYGHCRLFYDDDSQYTWDWPRQAHYVSGDILAQEIHRPFLLPIMVLVRKHWIERVGGFNMDCESSEDWDLWLRIALAGARFHYLPGETVAWYRIRSTRTAEASFHYQSGLVVLRRLWNLIGSQRERNRLDLGHAIGQWQYSYGHALVEEGQRRTGVIEMAKSLRLNRERLGRKLVTISGLILLSASRARAVKAVLRPWYVSLKARLNFWPTPKGS